MTLRVAVIGAGLIGARRSASAAKLGQLEVVIDTDEERAAELAHRHGCHHASNWGDAIRDPQIDVVAVCTPNKFLAPIATAALHAGKHVLVEKPMGRNAAEAAEMVTAARATRKVLKVGFTLRFQPAIREAHALVSRGDLGPLYFLNGVYGHGGRSGYGSEWRGNADLAGGGELLDQGVHLLDLSRWFLGELEVTSGLTARFHWDVGQLEDNAFVLLQGRDQVAVLHTSWTMWKNRFWLEIVGRDGYARVDGLGGSYGTETLTVGRRVGDGLVPRETVASFQDAELCWDADWQDLIAAVEGYKSPEVDGAVGHAILQLVDDIYSIGKNVGATSSYAEISTRASGPSPHHERS